jgi:hypothetical protein
MNREEYIAALEAIITHDKIISRIRNVSCDLAREVGDDFGGLAIIPETPLRSSYIELIETMARDETKMTSYFLDECLTMANGGSVTLENGQALPVRDASECWAAIEAIKNEATP